MKNAAKALVSILLAKNLRFNTERESFKNNVGNMKTTYLSSLYCKMAIHENKTVGSISELNVFAYIRWSGTKLC